MSEFLSSLTWTCIELQGSLENTEVDEDTKVNLIEKHLTTVQKSPRDALPEFDPGNFERHYCNFH